MTTAIFLIALAAPFLWSIVNHADKFLLSKYFKAGGVGGLAILSTLFSIVLLPIIYFFDQSILSINPQGALILMLAGVFNALAILLYLYALQEDETSVVVPFMQLIPFFTFVFGYFILGETLSAIQIIGGCIITIGVLILSLVKEKGMKMVFKWKVSALMIATSILFGLYGVLFKFVSLSDGFWAGAFWEAVGLILFGIVLFCISSYRKEFFSLFKQNSVPIIGLNLASEMMTIAGNWLMAYASLFVTVALVMLVSAYQPVFVLLIGTALSVFLPHLVKEDIRIKALAQKGIAIAIIVFGTYLL
ncbi:MAG: hypothetical protein RIT04_352 [Candidatus Parcubacteria bacterium]|jgi:drug/metabolite transporter (DMT)-like permease